MQLENNDERLLTVVITLNPYGKLYEGMGEINNGLFDLISVKSFIKFDICNTGCFHVLDSNANIWRIYEDYTGRMLQLSKCVDLRSAKTKNASK